MIESPINPLQELMCITAEESGELVQQCMKIMRKYDNADLISEDDRGKLVEEIGDVFHMIELMVAHQMTDWKEIHDRADEKNKKLKIWSNLTE